MIFSLIVGKVCSNISFYSYDTPSLAIQKASNSKNSVSVCNYPVCLDSIS